MGFGGGVLEFSPFHQAKVGVFPSGILRFNVVIPFVS
jgi:hypothetical protein